MHAAERVPRDALGQQIVEDQLDLPLAANHADVGGGSFGQVKQGLFVVVVAPGDNQAVRSRIDVQPRERLLDGADQQAFRRRKPREVAVFLPVIGHPDIEVGVVRELGDLLSDMPRAHHHQATAFQERKIRDACRDIRPGAAGERAEIRHEARRGGVAGAGRDDLAPLVTEKPVGRPHDPGLILAWVQHHRLGHRRSRQQPGPKLLVVLEGIARANRIDQHPHAAAADQSVVPAVVVVQLECEQFGATILQQLQAAAFDLGFHAAPPQGADLGTVGEHQHGRPRLLRSRAAGFDQRREGDRFAAGKRGQERLEKGQHQPESGSGRGGGGQAGLFRDDIQRLFGADHQAVAIDGGAGQDA